MGWVQVAIASLHCKISAYVHELNRLSAASMLISEAVLMQACEKMKIAARAHLEDGIFVIYCNSISHYVVGGSCNLAVCEEGGHHSLHILQASDWCYMRLYK